MSNESDRDLPRENEDELSELERSQNAVNGGYCPNCYAALDIHLIDNYDAAYCEMCGTEI